MKTHFGFKEVNTEDKAPMVKGVFDNVASKYDIMNDVMSMGTHRLWKDKFIKALNPRPNSKLLDVAGGTGDIAFRFAKACDNGSVVVSDINHNMLREGYKSSIDKNVRGNLQWVCADAQNIPYPDNEFDYYTIAFGIRNVTDISAALNEAYRVLKPGGRFLCLEFSKVDSVILEKFYDFYSFKVIPKMGELIASDSDSYQYLVESIRKFPSQDGFLKMIEDSGFTNAKYTNLSGGVVAIHSGWKA
jgi:demethylmenaquinone methyltransferase/2-methoxy-6-polyprenyl-1,4-benzoquinol methylase